MISFYPGPSRVYSKIPDYIKKAYKKNILSINHRSKEFIDISRQVVALMKKKLGVPDDYMLFYTSSATECWEIIAQSLIQKKSHHIYNGAFGQKWFEYTRRLQTGSKSYAFHQEHIVDSNLIRNISDVICITQNETSNGTQISNDIIHKLKSNNPKSILAVDATSSMAGIVLDFNSADVWFASVQKCFGLPAGLGVMVCSPQAIERIKKIGENSHYNSLMFMNTMMEKYQTPFTPNVLNIYLLMKVLKDNAPIEKTDVIIKKRYNSWIEFLEQRTTIKHLIKNTEAHSYTVLPVSGDVNIIASIKTAAKKEGILLGEGYGDLKESTFRIANFPAIKKSEIKRLQDFLEDY